MAKGKGGFIGQDGLNAPDAPNGVSGTAGNEQVTVSWTNPTDVGGSTITGYVISSNPSVPIEPPSLATASYTNKSFSLSGQGTYNFYAMTFNGDGTKAYFTGFGPDAILQYSLSTAWDISTASYDNVSLDVSGETTAGQSGLVFSPDGSKIYMASYTPDAVYQYNLSTPFDMSSGSYSNNSLTVNEDTNVQDVYLKPDGTKLFVLGDTNNSVFQYTMSTPFDLSTASYDSVSFSTATQQTNCTGLFFSPDGTTMLICGYFPIQADKYTLSTPWDITTATHDTSFDVTNEFGSNSPNAIFAGNDLSTLFVAGSDGGNGVVYQYAVGMPTGSPFVYGGLTNGTSYTFNVWAINAFGWSVASDASGSVSPVAPPIAIYAGGEAPSAVNTMSYKDITSTGNFSDFGDLTVVLYKGAAVGTSTRAVFASGNGNNTMGYVNPQSTGNATDFGDLAGPRNTTQLRQEFGAAGNSTRGLFLGGAGISNVCDYITIATLGNTTDFGDLNTAVEKADGCGSPTRAICGGGADNGSNNTIQYRTFATLGNFSDFGNLTTTYSNDPAAFSSDTRGLIGGTNGNARMDYITIASTGNAAEFGNLSDGLNYGPSGASSNTRGLVGGGSGWTAGANTVEYFTIASLGNSTDFGNLSYSPVYHPTSASAGHGGLQ